MKATAAPLLTRRALAAKLEVHMGTIVKWDRDGMPVAQRGRKGKPSLYDEAAVRHWLAEREAAAAEPGAAMDLVQERAKKEHWQALLAQQTHQVRAHELLPAAEVAKAWSAEVAAVRTKILSSYTSHADKVYRAGTLKGLAGVEASLKEIAYDILRELAGQAEQPKRAKRKKSA